MFLFGTEHQEETSCIWNTNTIAVIPMTHPHTHELEHAHDHSHTAAPRDELIALMRYMVGHNVSHTNELKELAHKLAHTGDSEACAQILDAVQDYETGNQKLAASLDQLQK